MSARQRIFRPGQFLFKEGDPSHSMYLIVKGSVSIRKRRGNAFVEIAKVYSKEVIGELSFFDRQPRSAGAVAINEVEALEIEFEALDKIYTNVPDYLKSIISAVADRLRKANETIRRLQKSITSDDYGKEDPDLPTSEELDAASVLASTAELPVSEKTSKTSEDDGKPSDK